MLGNLIVIVLSMSKGFFSPKTDLGCTNVHSILTVKVKKYIFILIGSSEHTAKYQNLAVTISFFSFYLF